MKMHSGRVLRDELVIESEIMIGDDKNEGSCNTGYTSENMDI